MPFQLSAGIPDKYRDRITKRITFVVLGRLRWILPLTLGLIAVFSVLTTATSLWGTNNRIFLYIDLAGLAVFGIIYLIYRKTRVDTADEIGGIHYFIQTAAAAVILGYGAVCTVFDFSTVAGITTYIVCLLVVGSMMYLRPGPLLLMSLCGVFVIYAGSLILEKPYQTSDYIQEIFLFVIVIFITMVVNRYNVQTLLASCIFELELEDKVDERTRELAEQTERALQADKLKTVFLANMSHEIRTPLNGILGFSNLLRDDRLDIGERHKYLDIVINSGKTLLEILNGIIEVSRIESGECEVFHEEFLLKDVISEVVDSFRSHEKVRSGEIILSDSSDHASEQLIVSDRLKVVQIMINLVSNAIKYTDSGRVEAGFKRASGGRVELYVKDTGKGIAEKDVEQIFTRFQQLDLNPYARSEGVGLGLTIVKGYVDMLGGIITVDSVLGKGSEFRLTLPVG